MKRNIIYLFIYFWPLCVTLEEMQTYGDASGAPVARRRGTGGLLNCDEEDEGASPTGSRRDETAAGESGEDGDAMPAD